MHIFMESKDVFMHQQKKEVVTEKSRKLKMHFESCIMKKKDASGPSKKSWKRRCTTLWGPLGISAFGGDLVYGSNCMQHSPVCKWMFFYCFFTTACNQETRVPVFGQVGQNYPCVFLRPRSSSQAWRPERPTGPVHVVLTTGHVAVHRVATCTRYWKKHRSAKT